MSVVGISIGGGKIEVSEVNGFKLRLTGGMPAILLFMTIVLAVLPM